MLSSIQMNDNPRNALAVRARTAARRSQPKKRVRLPATERQTQFVRIAFEIIAEKGFEGLRFQEVAKRAGVNNATLLHRFSSKEALIQGVVHLLVDEMRKRRTIRRFPAKNAIEELHWEFEDLRRFIEQVPTFFIVLTEMALRARRDSSMAKMEAGRDQFWHERLKALIERGAAQGVFTAKFDTEAVVTSLMAQIKGISHHAALSPRGKRDLSVLTKEVADQVVLRLTFSNRGATRS